MADSHYPKMTTLGSDQVKVKVKLIDNGDDTFSINVTDSFNADFLLKVQAGKVNGAKVVWKFGRRENVGTTESDIWCGDAGVYTFPSTANNLSVVSTNNADTQEMFISGLDVNFNEITETVILNGTTPVISVEQYIRVNRCYNDNGVDLLGDVSFTHQGTGTSLACVRSYAQQTLQSIYTIPNGFTGYLFRGMVSVGKLKDAQIFFKFRQEGKVFRLSETLGVYQEVYEAERPFLKMLEKTDLKVSGISANANTDTSAQFGILLLQNDIWN